MRSQSAWKHVQNQHDDDPLPLENPLPLVVVDCEVSVESGCFRSGIETTHHHQGSATHKSAMVEWAIGQGIYASTAHDLAVREPQKFDEAVHEILHMDARRLAGLHNLGGWLVWYVRVIATGERRRVEPRARGLSHNPYSSLGS